MKKITNFALNIDGATNEQFDHCCSQEFVESASLMPDAHSGYVAPIGSVFLSKDHVVPSWVGYDIGCGMIACVFKDKDIINNIKDKGAAIFDEVNRVVPMGKGNINEQKLVSNKSKEDFKILLEKFSKGKYNKDVMKFIKTQAVAHLGSLGSGNHFIELGFKEDGSNDELWLIIHSGSRGVGHKVATHYMKEASGKQKGYEETHSLKIESEKGQEYLNVLEFGLEFALLNRLEMAYKVRDSINKILGKELEFDLWVNKNHNHAVKENDSYVHRKGATPAKKGERGVIPANMRDGSFLVEGLGNKEFLESSSHGAGRKLSRSQAKKKISLNEFKTSMKGIVGKVDIDTLDEAPDAYKNIFDVMEAQKDSVKIIGRVIPIINWKG